MRKPYPRRYSLEDSGFINGLGVCRYCRRAIEDFDADNLNMADFYKEKGGTNTFYYFSHKDCVPRNELRDWN